ncbi:class I SAM-dependent methyltransferase [Herbivorax sp. ANBcel31]|uniref:tRNA (mnm(5)s(2)U34)-methyltransferase n=1 Tax=Herbivorax sp. ANBcel31 TaxID=3069754 RepID=UPI0027AFB282|nr:class I SAM-dependent methyltransferase [Herbivorax sp. ANBcel31]MDQ2085777.1 class I SAM-dependent methyltransferase [Herbivorax sp. ANBcel31]
MQTIKNSLGQSHQYIKTFVKEGDTVVDATCGNGNDTIFLAQLVGKAGKVFAFDIQDRALTKTNKKLHDLKIENRVSLIKDGHENMDFHVDKNIKAVMFNLGYLPGGNHNISTKADTTICALKKAMDLLVTGGIITLVIYYGKDSGFDEKEKILTFLECINQKKFIVMKTDFINQSNCPPILVCIEKLRNTLEI